MKPSERKARTEALLKKERIPYNPALPCIDSEDETELRTPEEVGIRMFCLFCIIGTAYDWTDLSYRGYLKKYNLWKYLTHNEASFLSSQSPNRYRSQKYTWRCEALFLLMWAVGLFENLPAPTRQTNNEEIVSKFPSFPTSPWSFIRDLKMRPKTQILDASDLIYRLHWAARQAGLDGQPPPAGLDPEVVREWHYAINWLTKYGNLDWDDVTTDT